MERFCDNWRVSKQCAQKMNLVATVSRRRSPLNQQQQSAFTTESRAAGSFSSACPELASADAINL